ncbi:MAG: ubiquinone/menaquinone biosynthesis methyltransferase [Chloroflexota bacterium]
MNSDDIRGMFARIASKYDKINRIMSFGRDMIWRVEAIDHLDIKDGDRLLDVGAGTGDLAVLAAKENLGAQVVACDLTMEMVEIARERTKEFNVDWVVVDAHALPFAESHFDGVVSGFLLRNVSDKKRVLGEQLRVLNFGGPVVVLDTSPGRNKPIRALLKVYFRTIMPVLVRLMMTDYNAYDYLHKSTANFLPANDLKTMIEDVGFEKAGYVHRMFSTIAIHWAKKPIM